MKQGYTIGVSYPKQLIQESDAFGETVIDGIGRGANVTIACSSLEWKNGLLEMLFPYQATQLTATGSTYFDIGVVGVLDSNKAGTLILTSTANTPAASAPATLTATLAIIKENHELTWALDSRLREVPIALRVYPYSDTVYKFFTAT